MGRKLLIDVDTQWFRRPIKLITKNKIGSANGLSAAVKNKVKKTVRWVARMKTKKSIGVCKAMKLGIKKIFTIMRNEVHFFLRPELSP